MSSYLPKYRKHMDVHCNARIDRMMCSIVMDAEMSVRQRGQIIHVRRKEIQRATGYSCRPLCVTGHSISMTAGCGGSTGGKPERHAEKGWFQTAADLEKRGECICQLSW